MPDYLYPFVRACSAIEDMEFNARSGGGPGTALIEEEKETLRRAAEALARMPDAWGGQDAD